MRRLACSALIALASILAPTASGQEADEQADAAAASAFFARHCSGSAATASSGGLEAETRYGQLFEVTYDGDCELFAFGEILPFNVLPALYAAFPELGRPGNGTLTPSEVASLGWATWIVEQKSRCGAAPEAQSAIAEMEPTIAALRGRLSGGDALPLARAYVEASYARGLLPRRDEEVIAELCLAVGNAGRLAREGAAAGRPPTLLAMRDLAASVAAAGTAPALACELADAAYRMRLGAWQARGTEPLAACSFSGADPATGFPVPACLPPAGSGEAIDLSLPSIDGNGTLFTSCIAGSTPDDSLLVPPRLEQQRPASAPSQ